MNTLGGKILITVAAFSAALVSFAETPSVLGYSAWKELQVIEAQNKVARLSNKILLERKRIGSEEASNKVSEELKADELRLSSLNDDVQFAKDLTLEDYVANYLASFEEDEEALTHLLNKLSSEEKLQLVRSYLKLRRNRSTGFQPRLTGVPTAKPENPAL